MEKGKLIPIVIFLLSVFLWLFFFGQLHGISATRSDINMIDEGQFAAWISHMLHGEYMYKDFFLPYGPLLVYPIYLVMKFFGPTIFFVRLINVTLGVFLGICIAFVILKYLRMHWLVSIVTFLFILLIPGIHVRHWIGILVFFLAGISLQQNSQKIALLSGVFLGVSFLMSFEVGILTFFVLSGYIFVRSILKRRHQTRKATVLVMLLGMSMPLMLFSLIAFREGWLGSYANVTLEVVTANSGVNLANGKGLPNVFEGVLESVTFLSFMKFLFSKVMLFYWSFLLFILMFAGIIIRFLMGIATKKDTFIFLTIVFGILQYMSIVGRSGHYFLIMPVLFICIGYLLSLILKMKKKSTMTKVIGIIGIIFFITYGIRHMIIFRYTPFFIHQKNTVSRVTRISPIAISSVQVQDIQILQVYIQKNTDPNDTIFVFSNLPAIYFLVDRENPTRYDLPFLAYSRQKRLEIVSQLKASQPKVIIEDRNAWAIDDVSDRQRLPEVISYIEKTYSKRKLVGHFTIYTRNNL